MRATATARATGTETTRPVMKRSNSEYEDSAVVIRRGSSIVPETFHRVVLQRDAPNGHACGVQHEEP